MYLFFQILFPFGFVQNIEQYPIALIEVLVSYHFKHSIVYLSS